jgi:hypothetical protein
MGLLVSCRAKASSVAIASAARSPRRREKLARRVRLPQNGEVAYASEALYRHSIGGLHSQPLAVHLPQRNCTKQTAVQRSGSHAPPPVAALLDATALLLDATALLLDATALLLDATALLLLLLLDEDATPVLAATLDADMPEVLVELDGPLSVEDEPLVPPCPSPPSPPAPPVSNIPSSPVAQLQSMVAGKMKATRAG